MESALRPAEMLVGLLPLVLGLAVFVVLPLPGKPVFGFTDSGHKFRKVDPPTHAPLLSTRTFWLVFAICMAGAVGWALTEAISSAVQSGTVSLPGRRNYPRPVVPWSSAWAYLSGLTLMLAAVALPWFTLRGSTSRALAQLASALMGVIGYVLFLSSPLLSSWQGALLAAIALVAVVIHGKWRLRDARRQEPQAGMQHRYSESYLNEKLPPMSHHGARFIWVGLTGLIGVLSTLSVSRPHEPKYIFGFLFYVLMAGLFGVVVVLTRRIFRKPEILRTTTFAIDPHGLWRQAGGSRRLVIGKAELVSVGIFQSSLNEVVRVELRSRSKTLQVQGLEDMRRFCEDLRKQFPRATFSVHRRN